ncbi:glutamate 5-kinase [Melissococcus sp. OM08-11BH]|uniref:glutamate 5-kinase n=1 Tax=Melissococcus sp. OM08-11BH TaxID=2293110 RepID=UPI000E50D020|nr:glutamate 5-kinase [Melissococcus sp. OM08-11BH]RGI30323.1 glutamate 5-kinase [Melissococcus sp. OM08-11BH]
MSRKTLLKKSKRLVIKVGTSSLVLPNSEINLRAIDQLAFTLSSLRQLGYEVILVSSGAIGVGMNLLGLEKRPETIAKQQAVAAIGQSELIKIYTQRFTSYHQQSAQVLLTRDVIDFPTSRQNVINTFEELLTMGVIPIVNENDSVSVDELDHLTKFGDNDQLSAIVCKLAQADLLLMLSDIDGFYSNNPHTNPDAILYSHITEITEMMEDAARGKGSVFGTGGMTSKLKAAKRVLDNQSQMILASGKDPAILFDILEGKEVGTLFSN